MVYTRLVACKSEVVRQDICVTYAWVSESVCGNAVPFFFTVIYTIKFPNHTFRKKFEPARHVPKYTRRKSLCRTLFEVGIDLQKVQKQGREENMREDYPNTERWQKRKTGRLYLTSAAHRTLGVHW